MYMRAVLARRCCEAYSWVCRAIPKSNPANRNSHGANRRTISDLQLGGVELAAGDALRADREHQHEGAERERVDHRAGQQLPADARHQAEDQPAVEGAVHVAESTEDG